MRKINLFMDGNQIAATWDNFDSLQTSPAGFGDNILQAVTMLISFSSALEINQIVSSLENEKFVKNHPCPKCEGRGNLGTYMFRDPPEAKICPDCMGTGKAGK